MRSLYYIFIVILFLGAGSGSLVISTSHVEANVQQRFQSCMQRCRQQEARCYQGNARGLCSKRNKSCVLRCERYLSAPASTIPKFRKFRRKR